MHDRKTQADAAAALAGGVVELMKLLEDRFQLFRGNAYPSVPHLDLYGGFGEKGRTCLGVESGGYRLLLVLLTGISICLAGVAMLPTAMIALGLLAGAAGSRAEPCRARYISPRSQAGCAASARAGADRCAR